MEGRFALSGIALVDEAVPLEELHRLFEQGASREVLLDAIQQRSRSQQAVAPPSAISVAPASSLGDETFAAITTVVLNQAGENVTEFAPGDHYTLRVFVQDTRPASTTSESLRGVFRASVDLRFGNGVIPIGPPSFSEEFQSLRSFGTERATESGLVLESVGAVKGSLAPLPEWTTEPEWLLDASFRVESDATAGAIVTVPAQNDIESILLFGESSPIDLADVSPSQLQFSVSQLADTPTTPGPPSGPLLPPAPTSGESETPPPLSEVFVTGNAGSSDLLPQRDDLTESLIEQRNVRPLSDSLVPSFFDSYKSLLERLRADEDDRHDEDEEDGLIELELPQEGDPTSSVTGQENVDTTDDSDLAESESRSSDELGLQELWGIADLLLEAEAIEPLLGQYRMQFRIYSPEPAPLGEPTPAAPSERANQGMVDVAQFLRPDDGRRAESWIPDEDSQVARKLTLRGSRATAMTFDLDALFGIEARDSRLDREPAPPNAAPRPAPDDLSTIKAPSNE